MQFIHHADMETRRMICNLYIMPTCDLEGDMKNHTYHPSAGLIMPVDLYDTQFYTLWSAEVTKVPQVYTFGQVGLESPTHLINILVLFTVPFLVSQPRTSFNVPIKTSIFVLAKRLGPNVCELFQKSSIRNPRRPLNFLKVCS